MAEVVLFHHVLGRTPGCRAFAEALRDAGHVVHTPDLYDGVTFTNLAEGQAHAERIGFGAIIERGTAAVADLPGDVVYAGLSLGVMPAQMLAQTRAGASGALLLHGAVPPAEFGGAWPEGVPAQIHTMERDELGDVDVAREMAATIPDVELFLYDGSAHLFTDRGLPDYDEAATALLQRRVRAFIERIT